MTRSSSAQAIAIAQTTPKRAWDVSGLLDPTTFYPKFGPLPAVVGVRDQTGSWDTVGRSRTLLLSDGSSVVETITDADSPTYFAYELSDFTKLFGRLVAGARAEWRFERRDMGTSILLLIFAAVTLGGLGTAFGALIGSIIVGLLVEVSTLWIPSDLKYVGALVVLIVILLFRPQGILGRRERIG